MSTTDKYAATGAGVGGLLGYGIGRASGNGGVGAAIGTAAGLIGGAVVGNETEKAEARQEARTNAAIAAAEASRVPALSLEDVVRMSNEPVTEGVIIDQIRNSGATYNLTTEQVIWLKRNAVPDTVIREMQATARRTPTVVAPATRTIVREVPVVQPVYVAEPVRPAGFGVRYEYHRHR